MKDERDPVEVIKHAIGSFVADKHDPAEAAREAIAALEAQGYAIVPVVPTEAMLSAGRLIELYTDFDEPGRDVGEAARDVWATMLKTRPSPPETPK
jgi:hypothetical protein